MFCYSLVSGVNCGYNNLSCVDEMYVYSSPSGYVNRSSDPADYTFFEDKLEVFVKPKYMLMLFMSDGSEEHLTGHGYLSCNHTSRWNDAVFINCSGK